ncbi:MAG: hypothetical protein WAM66_06240 [Acidobacteriaceae bacterium]
MRTTPAQRETPIKKPAHIPLSSLLNGKADLFGDAALRIEKAFGVKMDTHMRMQPSYDIVRTRKKWGANAFDFHSIW